MENDDDFTFCQVGTTSNQDNFSEKIHSDQSFTQTSLEIPEIVPDIPEGNSINSCKQEGVIGSLSFSVTRKTVNQPVADGSVTESSGVQVLNKPVSSKFPKTRAKVPFEKGYSQMDWLKLTQTHPDLAGLKKQSNKRLISMNEVKQHQTEDSMWTVLKGRVYNISPYMKFHPGGEDMLMKAVGKDCTSLFNKYHAWVNAEFLLEKCMVGMLDDSH